jgi:hypothetical protein
MANLATSLAARLLNRARETGGEPVFLRWKVLEAASDGDFFVRSGPGPVKLPSESAQKYIRTRFAARTPSASA